MTKQASIADVLGIDPSQAADVPRRIAVDTFFSELAKKGIAPQNEDQALAMLQASDVLESKRAAFQSANDPVQRSLNLLLGGKKQAASPADDILRSSQQRARLLISDPHVYGAMLVGITG